MSEPMTLENAQGEIWHGMIGTRQFVVLVELGRWVGAFGGHRMSWLRDDGLTPVERADVELCIANKRFIRELKEPDADGG